MDSPHSNHYRNFREKQKSAERFFHTAQFGIKVILLDWRYSTIDVVHIPTLGEIKVKKMTYTTVFHYIDSIKNLMNS